jgi:hypothetical protein
MCGAFFWCCVFVLRKHIFLAYTTMSFLFKCFQHNNDQELKVAEQNTTPQKVDHINENNFIVSINYFTKQIKNDQVCCEHTFSSVPIRVIDGAYYVEIPEGAEYSISLSFKDDHVSYCYSYVEVYMTIEDEMFNPIVIKNNVENVYTKKFKMVTKEEGENPGANIQEEKWSKGLIKLRFCPLRKIKLGNSHVRKSKKLGKCMKKVKSDVRFDYDHANETLIALRILSVSPDSILIPSHSTHIPPPI